MVLKAKSKILTEGEKAETAHIRLEGGLDETAGPILAELQAIQSGKVIINFANIKYVNSLGIRHWINFISLFQEGKEVIFEGCTQDLMMQINMLPAFQGECKVASFSLLYECESCGHEGTTLLSCEDGRTELSRQIQEMCCEQCQEQVEADEDLESILLFFNR
ncbi:MAG: hypothetical protein ACOH5I_03070 [Oligoflexus sp.]